MFKRVIAFCLTVSTVLMMSGCGKEEMKDSSQSESKKVTETVTQASETATETVTEIPEVAAETVTEIPEVATETTIEPSAPMEEAKEGIVLEYPANMQALGFTDSLFLEKCPERVISLSITPVLCLYNLGVNFIAIPSSSAVQWPEGMKDITTFEIGRNTNIDIESVIAMEPDLVILGYTSADTYGKVLTDMGIPVYYVDAGHTVSYDSIKLQTEVLIDAFGKDSEAGKEMIKAFSNLEDKLTETVRKLEGKTCMTLQSSPPSHYIQTSGGTLGSMAKMIGLTNVYSNDHAAMVQLDYETTIDLKPDVVLCVGASPTGEEHKAMMEEDFAKNPEYWNSIPAIANGDVIYLPVNFILSTGISDVDRISELADIVLAHFEK